LDSLQCHDIISQNQVSIIEGKTNMSIAMGLIGIDGIVLGTDSQSTYLQYNKQTQKLWKLTDSIGLMSIGYNSDYQHFLIKQLLKMPINDFIVEVENCSDYVRKHVSKFAYPNLSSLRGESQIEFIFAGYDSEMKPRIICSDSAKSQTPFSLTECELSYVGGVDSIAYNWIKKIGYEKRIGCEDLRFPCEFLKKFMVMVLLETFRVSNVCSEPIQMAVVTQQNGYQPITMDEINKIKNSLDDKQQWLYDYLASTK
jgi:20S proteasome alpha/beta subunit